MRFSLILLVFLCAVTFAAKLKSCSKKKTQEDRLKALEKKVMGRIEKDFMNAIESGDLTQEHIKKLVDMGEEAAEAELFNAFIKEFMEEEMSGPAEYHMVDGKKVRKCKTVACEIVNDIAEFIKDEFRRAFEA
eukprot:TRINITY_DN2033_c0_g1_i10.p2 TRINITY_DN2033_c0_g1~~TRINITY_DN2033_c0_g1_i10.p2  ORF type:complete len:133 (-),score=47.11 TRINITY_DN2033_c0_g1_i10:995-1393(-)